MIPRSVKMLGVSTGMILNAFSSSDMGKVFGQRDGKGWDGSGGCFACLWGLEKEEGEEGGADMRGSWF